MLKVCVLYVSQLFSAMFEAREIYPFYTMSSMFMTCWGEGPFLHNLKWVQLYFIVKLSAVHLCTLSNCNRTHVQISTMTRVALLAATLLCFVLLCMVHVCYTGALLATQFFTLT